MKIQDFKVGRKYTNAEITEAFKVSLMRGMARSLETNSLVLISKQTSNRKKRIPYEDKWINGKLHYTGEGQTGDQSLEKGQNKTLFHSSESSITVYLFEVLEDKEYIYRGIVKLQDKPYSVNEYDITGSPRKVWKFPLTLSEKQILSRSDVLKDIQEQKERFVAKQPYNQIKDFAFKVSEENEKYYVRSNGKNKTYRKAVTKIYDEDPYISQYAKNLAKGICSLCHEKAPFIDKNNQPYLIAHRIEPLSQGGPDTIENTVAVCPNCHERLKILNSDEDKVRLRKVIKAR